MPGTLAACRSCKKTNKGEGRYCIHCGSIIRPVYCARCGRVNPEDIIDCLECGNPIPRLNSIRWGPIVNVIQPTEAMEAEAPVEVTANELPQTDIPQDRGRLSRLKDRFRSRKAFED